MGTGLVVQEYGNWTGGYKSMGTGLVVQQYGNWTGAMVQEYGNRVRVRNILCLVYTVQPLDSNFISCVNIHNYEHFGWKGFEKDI